jgi:Lon protease-like protein
VGCAGRLTAYQELDDGRILITLTGICRFRVSSEIVSPNAYRICGVDFRDYRDDLDSGHGEEAVDREHLLGVLKGYLERRQMKADWRAISNASTEFLVNTLSVISPYGPEEKQALLEARDLKTRADVLVALAEMELAGGDNGPATTLQ